MSEGLWKFQTKETGGGPGPAAEASKEAPENPLRSAINLARS